MRKFSILILSAACLVIVFVMSLSCGVSAPSYVVVEPAGINDNLLNPHRGFITTHQFNEDLGDKLHPKCTIVQFRWYWKAIEPEEGKINFDLIDKTIDKARANGQKLDFRIMCQNGVPEVPDWLRAKASGEPYHRPNMGDNDHDPAGDFKKKKEDIANSKNWQPHYDDPVFLEYHKKLINALGAHYDGHPDMDCMDIGTVGRWGEWHTGGTGMEMPGPETMHTIIDHYFESFKETPLIMLIGGGEGLRYAIEKGAGWRADCLGDMGGFDPNWSHMKDFYQPALDEAGANNAWEHAPVIFETCWTIQKWYDEGWDIDYILSEALRWHVTGLNNGTESFPEPWWDKLMEFEKKMGYRFAIKEFRHPDRTHAGKSMLIDMTWANEGVAPIYYNYPLALQFKPVKGGDPIVVDLGVDTRSWMPSEAIPMQLNLDIPPEMPAGEYEVGVALLDPNTMNPGIKLANEGLQEDGWYRFSRITIK